MKKTPGPNDFMGEFFQTFKEEICQLRKFFEKIEEEKKNSITLMSKPKTHKRKLLYASISHEHEH